MKETNHSLPTRASLLARLKDWGDQEGWREFFDTYWHLVFSVARKQGLSDAEAEDVVQDLFVELGEKMKSFQYDPSIGSFKGWLCTRTRRRVIDRRRKHARQPDYPGASTPLDVTAEEPAGDANWDEWERAWDAEWRQHLLDAALERSKRMVGVRQFQIFDLHVLQEKSAAEVSAALGIPTAQVHLAKFRVRLVVRRELQRLERELI